MEKFFIIGKDSQLYNLYFEYIKDLETNRKIYDDFCKQYGIEAGSYIPGKDYLVIIPSEKDKDRFMNDFTQEYWDGGGRQFKKRSQIGKAWTGVMSDIKAPRKPGYFYIINLVGRYSERIFHIGDILYGSLKAECTYQLHECMKEIKASEFYKIIEDHNESIKQKGG